jgi:hypothetical protein
MWRDLPAAERVRWRDAPRRAELKLTRLSCEYDGGFREFMGGAKVDAALRLPVRIGQPMITSRLVAASAYFSF